LDCIKICFEKQKQKKQPLLYFVSAFVYFCSEAIATCLLLIVLGGKNKMKKKYFFFHS